MISLDFRTLNPSFLDLLATEVHLPIDTYSVDIDGFVDEFDDGFQKIWPFVDSSNLRKIASQCFQASSVTPSLDRAFIYAAMSYCSYQKGSGEDKFFALYRQAKDFFKADTTVASPLKCAVAYFIVRSCYSTHATWTLLITGCRPNSLYIFSIQMVSIGFLSSFGLFGILLLIYRN